MTFIAVFEAYLEHQGSFHVETVPDNVVYLFLDVLFFWNYLPSLGSELTCTWLNKCQLSGLHSIP